MRIKVSENEISQEIDLEDLTGVNLSQYPLLMNEIAQATIDFVKDRAQSGFGLGGQKLKSPYSDAYANSLEFQAAGKSKDQVNMTLTGDMLGLLDVLEQTGSIFKYGLPESQAPKGYNHQVGDTVPKRPWFGVEKKEFIDNVLVKFDEDINRIKENMAEDELYAGAIQRAAIRIINEGSTVDEELGDLFDQG